MKSDLTVRSRVGDVARLIEDDIRHRGLAAGEPYLTADEVARTFGVHQRMASRAMQSLAGRDVLVRRRGVGTFIGSAASHPSTTQLQCVHVLVGSDRQRTGLPSTDVLAGVRSALPEHDVQMNYLPPVAAEGYVREVYKKGTADDTMAGVVLLGCPLAIQLLAVKQAVPAVLLGSVYASTADLPSVDVDHFDTGRRMARYLIGRGNHRIALLLRDAWLAGDNQLLQGIQHECELSGRNHVALTIRSLPADRTLIEQELRALFSSTDRPTGLMCRGSVFAEAAFEVATETKLRMPGDLDFVYERMENHHILPREVAHVVANEGFRQAAHIAGKMLSDLLCDERLGEQHIVLPVKLVNGTAGNDRPLSINTKPGVVPAITDST